MLEIIDYIKQQINEHGDKYFIDKYKLQDGLYIKINKNGEIDSENILLVDSKQEKKEAKIGINNIYPLNIYDWFKEKDFYSRTLYDDANKCIDPKQMKILSINPYTLFIKRVSLPDIVDFTTDNIKNLMKREIIENLKEESFINLIKDEKLQKIIQKPKVKELLRTKAIDETLEDKDLTKVINSILKNNELLKIVGKKDYSKSYLYRQYINQHFSKLKRYKDGNFDYYKNTLIDLGDKLVEVCDEYQLKKDQSQRVKVFFEEDTDKYIDFYNEYMKEKVFLVDKYNEEVEGSLYGAFAFNNTLNEDKPFLQMKTTTFKAPFRTTIEDATLFYKMNLVLFDIKKELELIFDMSSSKEVLNYEVINNKFNIHEFRDFKILGVDNYKDIISEGQILEYTREDVQKYLNNNFLKGIIYKLYSITDAENASDDISDFYKNSYKAKFTDTKIFNELINDRNILKGYFEKNYSIDLFKTILKITNLIMEYEISSSSDNKKTIYQLRDLWDKQISILNYFSRGEIYSKMPDTIKQIYINLEENILNNKDKIFEIQNDETFYFLSGQVAKYIVSQTKTKNPKAQLVSPFINIRNSKNLKDKVIESYDMYSHSISLYSQSSINRAIQSIMGYTPQNEIKDTKMKHIFTAGLVGNNIFYKSEKQDNRGVKINDGNEK